MIRLHKLTSIFVFSFIALHLTNHLLGLKGVETHTLVLGVSRIITRDPILELIVLLVFFLQMLTGFALSKRIWAERKDWVHQLQAASGTIISLFLLVHLIHIGFGRFASDVDTNFYYIAKSFSLPLMGYVLMGFYGLGVTAFFVHIGIWGHEVVKDKSVILGYGLIVLATALGGFVAYLLLSLFLGHYFPIEYPTDYQYLFAS